MWAGFRGLQPGYFRFSPSTLNSLSCRFCLHLLLPVSFSYLPKGLYASNLSSPSPSNIQLYIPPSLPPPDLSPLLPLSFSLHWSVHSGLAAEWDSSLTPAGPEQALLANWKTVQWSAGLKTARYNTHAHTQINTQTHKHGARWAVYWGFLDVSGQKGIARSRNTERNEKCD